MLLPSLDAHVLIAEMREWLLDCVSGACGIDEDVEISEASDAEILRWVGREYEGGVAGFIAASGGAS